MKRLLCLLLCVLLLSACAAPDISEPTETAAESTGPTETAPPPETIPETAEAPSYIETLLDSMTLRQKVGQLFIAAPESLSGGKTVTEFTPELAQALETYPVGGIILFGANIKTPTQVTALNTSFQSASAIPLFLCVDEEGGLVARLANNSAFNLRKYQSAASVGASGDPIHALCMGKAIGRYLREYGFNLDFAPVADVNTNPNNPVIGSRAFSSDAATAAAMASAMASGLNRQGIIATYKHFPGHGDTAEDSHAGLAVSYKTEAEMLSCEWLPFMEAGGNDMVMVGHIAVPELTGDLTPSTLSYRVVTQLLKEQLGFRGLVITDSLSMGAITNSYSSEQAALSALNAGCDILLMPQSLPEAFDAILAAVDDGSYSEEQLNTTVRRILEFKQAHGLLPES